MSAEAIRNNFLLSLILLLGTVSAASCQKKNIPEISPPDKAFIDNGIIKLGVDLTLGGAITYISDSRKIENLINNYDWGRQIQMSFYGGPNPFTPNGKEPSADWKFLGWNPIQSGDYAGNRAKILDYSSTPTSIYIKSIPMQWPLNNEPCDCYFESSISLAGNTVKIKSTIVNQRVDKQQYTGRHQEQPAVYTNAKWNKLITYRGLAPFTNDTLSHIKKLLDNFAWEDWQATENWAANVDSSNWGLGVWNEGTQEFKGGFAGNWGDKGGEKDFPTAYISPIQQEILDHNINYSYEYTLILGTIEEIRSYVYSNTRVNRIPSYKFTSNRQNWIYQNTIDAGWPISNFLQVNLKDNSALLGPVALWNAAQAPTLNIEAAYTNGAATMAKIYWKQYGQKTFTEQNSIEFPVVADGSFRSYQVPLSIKPGYSGMITSLKFVPSLQVPLANSQVKIKSIAF